LIKIRIKKTIKNCDTEINEINKEIEKKNKKQKGGALINKIDDMKSNRKRGYKISKVEQQIKDIVSDLHWKTAVYLTDNYGTIFMGKLESQKCAQQSKNHKLKFYYLFRLV
jgi:seryl-tRNA synthetase